MDLDATSLTNQVPVTFEPQDKGRERCSASKPRSGSKSARRQSRHSRSHHKRRNPNRRSRNRHRSRSPSSSSSYSTSRSPTSSSVSASTSATYSSDSVSSVSSYGSDASAAPRRATRQRRRRRRAKEPLFSSSSDRYSSGVYSVSSSASSASRQRRSRRRVSRRRSHSRSLPANIAPPLDDVINAATSADAAASYGRLFRKECELKRVELAILSEKEALVRKLSRRFIPAELVAAAVSGGGSRSGPEALLDLPGVLARSLLPPPSSLSPKLSVRGRAPSPPTVVHTESSASVNTAPAVSLNRVSDYRATDNGVSLPAVVPTSPMKRTPLSPPPEEAVDEVQGSGSHPSLSFSGLMTGSSGRRVPEEPTMTLVAHPSILAPTGTAISPSTQVSSAQAPHPPADNACVVQVALPDGMMAETPAPPSSPPSAVVVQPTQGVYSDSAASPVPGSPKGLLESALVVNPPTAPSEAIPISWTTSGPRRTPVVPPSAEHVGSSVTLSSQQPWAALNSYWPHSSHQASVAPVVPASVAASGPLTSKQFHSLICSVYNPTDPQGQEESHHDRSVVSLGLPASSGCLSGRVRSESHEPYTEDVAAQRESTEPHHPEAPVALPVAQEPSSILEPHEPIGSHHEGTEAWRFDDVALAFPPLPAGVMQTEEAVEQDVGQCCVGACCGRCERGCGCCALLSRFFSFLGRCCCCCDDNSRTVSRTPGEVHSSTDETQR